MEPRHKLENTIFELAKKHSTTMIGQAVCFIRRGGDVIEASCSLIEAQEDRIIELTRLLTEALHRTGPPAILIMPETKENGEIKTSPE